MGSQMASVAKSLRTPEFETLRECLVELRNTAGLSQRAVAEKLDVSPSWVAKVEIGERRIDLVEFCWFCRAVGRDPAKVAPRVIRRMTSRR